MLDKFKSAGLTPSSLTVGGPLGVAESPIQMSAVVRAIHPVDGAESALRALEVSVLSTHVDEALLLAGAADHFNALAWDPLIMKFTEYFAGGTNVRPSSLARGWGMPPLDSMQADARGG